MINFLLQVSTRNNVSTRISTESFKFRRTPAQVLRTGRYVTANLRKYDGFMNFQYQPPHNGTTEFYILPCGGGIVRAKLRGPSGFIRVFIHFLYTFLYYLLFFSYCILEKISEFYFFFNLCKNLEKRSSRPRIFESAFIRTRQSLYSWNLRNTSGVNKSIFS